jgi:hypothetical protein
MMIPAIRVAVVLSLGYTAPVRSLSRGADLCMFNSNRPASSTADIGQINHRNCPDDQVVRHGYMRGKLTLESRSKLLAHYMIY